MRQKSSSQQGNPQGKGLCTTLGLLQEVQASCLMPDIGEDGPARIVEDYLSTLLVVSSEFKFKPVPGVRYSLYFKNGRLMLSLITPEEGGRELYDEPVAHCILKKDLSWTVTGIEGTGLDRVMEAGNQAELTYSGKETRRNMEGLRFLLKEIQSSVDFRCDGRLGYYQNVMLFLVQKALRYRLNRLLESDLCLAPEERQLLMLL